MELGEWHTGYRTFLPEDVLWAGGRPAGLLGCRIMFDHEGGGQYLQYLVSVQDCKKIDIEWQQIA